MKLLVVASLALVATTPELGRVESAITAGTIDPGYPAVGALVSDQGFQCTVVLVGARTALTAAHCLAPGLTGFRVTFGEAAFAIARAAIHPAFDPSTYVSDVGVLVLEEAPPVARLSVGSTVPPRGAWVTLVGLGCLDARPCTGGTPRSARTTVAEVTADELVVSGEDDGAGHCNGDSGGPLLFGGVVAGVHTWGPVSCQGASHDARLDALRPWLEETSGGDIAFGEPAFESRGCSP